MYRDGDRLVLSASDLVGFLLCEHLAALELAAAEGGRGAPEAPASREEDDPELAVLLARGLEHERAYLEALEAEGRSVVRIEGDASGAAELARRERETREAMARGVDVVYQGTFFHPDDGGDGGDGAGDSDTGIAWRGHADFLRRVDGEPSDLGDHLYEPEDTKLARHVKPGAVIQLASYAEHVARLQGKAPPRLHVVLGGKDRERESIPARSVAAYFRAAKARFLAHLAAPPGGTYPEPCEHCPVCRWREACEARRERDDHLSRVAGLSREQARKLRERARIDTMEALAKSRDGEAVRGIAAHTLERLRGQARLQVQARALSEDAPPPYELLPCEPERGLEALPEPSEGDLFFDMEGDPYVGDGGLEYLFGVGWVEDGAFRYRTFWAHDARAERRAFEDFVDLVMARRARWPALRVYHYAPYEPAALGRLMGRHGTREAEIDALLRGGVLVDLYRVVQQALRIGVPSYSLKTIEPLFRKERTGAITEAGASIAEYERWIQQHDPAILRALADYNRDDCESLRLLRDWLEARRAEAEARAGRALARPAPRQAEASDGVAAESEAVDALARALDPDGAGGEEGAPPEARARWLLAQLLEWHRREEKPEWWWYFRRVACTEDELYEDTEAIAGLAYEGVAGREGRSLIHRYRFDAEQEHKLRAGTPVADPDSERTGLLGGGKPSGPGTLVEVDPTAGTLHLKRASYSDAPHPRSLIPTGPIRTDAQKQALRELALWVAEHGVGADGPFRAARDLLRRVWPRVEVVAPGAPLRAPGEDLTEAAVRLASGLDRSCLPIQGPPGSGKTTTGAALIVELVRQGRRVGITAVSHAVISHLLGAVMGVAEERGVPIRALQKADEDQACDHPDVRIAGNEEIASAVAADAVDVVAGTSWLFARPALRGSLDTLVVDEAGQLSLANALAVATAAENLVLIGDPQQLAQPSKGSHPPGAERSALEHLLGERDTLPPDRGLFLDRTWRLHPRICKFVSEFAYEERLLSRAGCERQGVANGEVLSGSGLRWLPVPHTGNRTSSEEEVRVIDEHFRALLGRKWTDAKGRTRKLDLDEILVVAPYNAQVSLLAEALPEGARVGTVDRFQGQEGAVVLVSFAASSAEDIPRGMEFLYSRNRLNVAVSRARALAVLVGSPTLLSVRCRTLHQLQLANGLCRFAELAMG